MRAMFCWPAHPMPLFWPLTLALNPARSPLREREAVEIRSYDIIYQIIEDVEKALKGILEPSYRDVVQGKATVRTVFSAGKAGKVAGVIVNEGRLTRNVAARVLRDGVVVVEGSPLQLETIQR